MGTGTSLNSNMEPPKPYGRKTISNKHRFTFLRNVAIVSDNLIVIKSRLQIVCVAPQKARLPIFSFVLGTSCLEKGDLRVLEISNKYINLTKYVGSVADQKEYDM